MVRMEGSGYTKFFLKLFLRTRGLLQVFQAGIRVKPISKRQCFHSIWRNEPDSSWLPSLTTYWKTSPHFDFQPVIRSHTKCWTLQPDSNHAKRFLEPGPDYNTCDQCFNENVQKIFFWKIVESPFETGQLNVMYLAPKRGSCGQFWKEKHTSTRPKTKFYIDDILPNIQRPNPVVYSRFASFRMRFYHYTEPNSAIHFSYFSRSSLDTDFWTFFTASSKSSEVVGWLSSSLARFLIWSGRKPWIRRRIDIIAASLPDLIKNKQFISSWDTISQSSS